jgi:hypothetical protein
VLETRQSLEVKLTLEAQNLQQVRPQTNDSIHIKGSMHAMDVTVNRPGGVSDDALYGCYSEYGK